MTDAVAEEVIAEAFRQLGKRYVLGAEGPNSFDCSGLMYWIFNETGHASLIGGTRRVAAGYARYFANAGKYSRSLGSAARGDLICYTHNTTRVAHIGIYLGDGHVISALVPPYGVRRHSTLGIDVSFDGVCLVDYPSDTGRTGPDTTDSEDDDPESNVIVSTPRWQGDIEILYEGVDVTADVEFSSGRFISVAGPDSGTADLRVRDKEHVYEPDYFHVGGTLELYINGRREWDGWVMSVAREYAFEADNTETPSATPRYWVLQGVDRNFLFARRYHFDQAAPANTDFGTYPANADDQSVIIDILANYTDLDEDDLDIVSGIKAVGPIDPYQEVQVVQVGQQWGEAMAKICLFNGAVFYIDPDRVVRYVDDQTETAPFVLSDEPAAGEVGYRDLIIRHRANEMYNEAFIWGVGLGSATPAFGHVVNDDAISEHGLFQWGETYTGMFQSLSAIRRADVLINGSPTHQRGHKEDVVEIEMSVYEPGLRVADGVAFHSGVWDSGMLFPFDDDPDPLPAPDPTNEFELMLARIRHIESHDNYTSQNNHSFAYGAYQIMPGNWRVWGPLALGYPRSSGVASRDIAPSSWFPEPTPSNQERVARWRLTKMYNNLGDPRRVGAAWRSGVSVARRDPCEWSRGTLIYANHVGIPLGYPRISCGSVLPDVTNPDAVRDDWLSPRMDDDIYPVRRIEMSFPTPTSVRFDIRATHSLDAAWAYKDPLPTTSGGPDPDDGWWNTEWLDPYGTGGFTGGDDDQPSEGGGTDAYFLIPTRAGIRDGTAGLDFEWYPAGSSVHPGIYSAAGIENGFANAIPYFIAGCDLGPGMWTGQETAEVWCELVEPGETWQFGDLELTPGTRQAMGYVPGVTIAVGYGVPDATWFGTGLVMGTIGGPGFVGEPNTAQAILNELPTWDGWDYGSVVIPGGHLRGHNEGVYICIRPSWESGGSAICDEDLLMPEYCYANGPRCSGYAGSGVVLLAGYLGLLGRIVYANEPTDWYNPGGDSGSENYPSTYWTGGMYRTQYPYMPGTLEIIWGGVRLTRGTDYIEVNPATGEFTIAGGVSGEGQIEIRYFVPAGSSSTYPLPGEQPPVDGSSGTGNSAIEAVIAQAVSFLGTPYQVGAESRSQIDCSGLVYRCFMDSGYGYLINNARLRAAGYTNYFSNKGMFSRSIQLAQRGDLISFGNAGNTRVVHIGIYLGGGQMISALVNPYGVSKTSIYAINEPVYGVCMVPYPATSSSTSTDTAGDDPDDTEEPQTPTPAPDPIIVSRIYRPRPQSQFGWGTKWDAINSNMAASAMLLDRHTIGIYSPIRGETFSTPPNHRTASGQTDPYTHTSGSRLVDAQTAWDVGWDNDEIVLPGQITWSTFVSKINEGRGAILHGDVMALPAEYRVSDWTDPHAMYVGEQLPDGTFWAVDPLGSTARLYPESALRAYASESVTCALSRITPKV